MSHVVIVTGGNRGIGYAVAEALWKRSEFHIILACRSVKSGEAAAATLKTTKGGGKVEVMRLDLSSFASVRQFCEEFKAKKIPLFGLVNNAGILRWQGYVVTDDGFEEHLQANHLGHFLLTYELLDTLTAQPGSRVVAVGSHLAGYARMRWGNLNDAEGFEAYKQSKLANLLHMQELSRRYGHPSPAKMLAMCVDPGEVNTDIVRHFPLASLIKPILLLIPERNTPEQGADSVVHCLVCGEEEAAALTGRLVRERKAVDVLGETGTVFSRMVLSVVMRTSCDKESHTPEAGKVLWDLSHALVTGKTKLPRERRSAAASFWRSPAVIIIFIFMLILPILAALFGPEGNPWALLLRR